jgi:catechol 2,3-dioxygenase-like lactoylglutathione lyase family enzyme
MAREGPEPILPAHDVPRTSAFYESLGFVPGYRDLRYEILRRGNLVVHLEFRDDLVPAANQTSCYWRVHDADGLYREFASLGLPSEGTPRLTEPFDEPWGMREFTLKDPAGNLIRVGHERSPAGVAEPEADELITLERRLAEAWVEGDRPFIEGLLAPDWTVTDPTGQVLARQRVLDETFSSTERRIDAMTVDEMEVRRLGPTVAVVTGRTRASGRYRGEELAVTLRFTDVWHLRNDQWQIAASQGTLIAPSGG